ncbi:hypothetical protein Q0590_12010 [Rhodocytophaga aerolata]|uniref:Uncharacterized protein n=1 Tax=Rhodocytophaga aerolata TaxID=455078 RepID=A0ABT8R711_9BACT|nr:hypothetical protein [Rhodocytophaga aerolata]MDO1446983.1 hypothetical protein [Rhodocytophaga aerolata]
MKLTQINLQERFTYVAHLYHSNRNLLNELYTLVTADTKLSHDLVVATLYRLNVNSVDFLLMLLPE